MSLRRKSCDACYKSRRKCSLHYPTCETCQRQGRECHYLYMPLTVSPAAPAAAAPMAGPSGDVVVSGAGAGSTPVVSSGIDLSALLETAATDETMLNAAFGLSELTNWSPPSSSLNVNQPPWNHSPSGDFSSTHASIPPQLVGPLGQLNPVESSSRTWQWVLDELRGLPRDFAHQAQNVFIHPQLYGGAMPRCIRAAFGISSSACLGAAASQAMMFRAVDAEVVDLLGSGASDEPLLDDLARLQALILYQTIRLFQGGVAQRVVAEQQQSALMTSALKLVDRAQAELSGRERLDWAAWMLAECARRTALVVYMLYGAYSIFREGLCVGFPTLARLPLSTAQAAWESEAQPVPGPARGEVVPYEAFTVQWLATAESRRLGRFERLVVAACRGIDTVEAYGNRTSLVT